MNRKQVLWAVVYYLVVLAVYWYTEEEHGPVKATILYHTYRTVQSITRRLGQFGLRLENAYHNETRVVHG